MFNQFLGAKSFSVKLFFMIFEHVLHLHVNNKFNQQKKVIVFNYAVDMFLSIFVSCLSLFLGNNDRD